MPHRQQAHNNARNISCAADLKAVIFDCDGVIVESEDLHRRAYNAAFEHFDIKVDGKLAVWDEEFYDDLQNRVGGGKPKMRWYFGKFGWPTSTVLPEVPTSEADQATLIDTLQDWKSAKYRDIIASGEVEAREGVLRLMDEAREAGIKLAVCSAATKSSVVFVVQNLLGKARFENLDVFLAGDDVPTKKPDPAIYNIAAEKMGLHPQECVVIEDSTIGLQAALGAGMRCVVTYTSSTKSQAFGGAERIVASLGAAPPAVTVKELQKGRMVQDDRVDFGIPAGTGNPDNAPSLEEN
jgi:HAD superfamily hydrolase (TIGR01509 family)